MPRPRPMISHAQNFEDVLLDRVFAEVEEGFYVDVGANDPDQFSLTRHFYDHGWRGINIEPGRVFARLSQARPRDINLEIAISDRVGTLTLHEYPNAHGLSTLEERPPDVPPELLAGRECREVRVRPLRDVLDEFQPPGIDFLSIDVEGHELAVIRGNDWSRWRPRVVLVEATEPTHGRPTHHAWEPLLLQSGYRFAWFDGLNRYYVRSEDEALLDAFATPPNVFDAFVTAYAHQLETQLQRRDAHVETLMGAIDHRDQYIGRLSDRARELDELKQGTGERTLQAGLWVARQLYRVSQIPARIRRLLAPRRAA